MAVTWKWLLLKGVLYDYCADSFIIKFYNFELQTGEKKKKKKTDTKVEWFFLVNVFYQGELDRHSRFSSILFKGRQLL